ncbi:unnamed protein product [Owenia fusiformis]|uniref:Uncharacterized protein n=1 Tax=Owenia fusiformis TaxID=6347 RepID=A0A8J1TAE8_OWEFU|nr:unnamed protein product [Owenia fusiformis]
MPPTTTEVRQRSIATEIGDQPAANGHANGFTKERAANGVANGHLVPSEDGKRKLVGVDGFWYDVTDFIDKHPGGPIIGSFIGEDATHVFHAYGHDPKILKHRKPVGTYAMRERHPADKDFDELKKIFEERGYFETDFVWYVKKSLVVFALWMTVWFLVTQFSAWYMHYLGAFVLAFVWQQSGFIMHDFMHSQVFRTNRKKDEAGGTFFGAAMFGISAHWWQDEHIFHHGMTNVVDVANRWVDPQMWEVSWAQNEKLFPLFTTTMHYIFIKIQHITFIPVVTFIGRYEIVTDSFRREKRWQEWVGAAFHWTWMCCLLSYLPTWREVGIFYLIAASVEGIFHFQLILSHYCKAFLNIDEFHRDSWYKFQIDSNMNLNTYWFMDWYYGGLNFHIEHHLFPKMARKYLRHASPLVKEVCAKHDIEYDSQSFVEALVTTLAHLKKAGTHFTLDPR